MKVTTFKPRFIATGLAIGLAMISQAYAVPGVFTVAPPLTAPFQADFINGASSELLHGDFAAGTLTANSGWLNFTGFSNGGNPVLPVTSGLGLNYQLYLTFDLAANYIGGTAFGTAGSNYNLSALNFQVWRDDLVPGPQTTFTQANAPGGIEATVGGGVGNNATDVLLGNGTLLSGVAGFDLQFGAFLNATTTYANTIDGTAFFSAPNPFYNLAFSAFNNTSSGVLKSGGCIAGDTLCTISVTQAIGGVDFNRVPEPATLALLGMGLMGVGISLRKRKAT